jgi:hypothetical protein
MPSSIINSDDGVVSGTSGLKSVGGDDGVLVFQSKGTETARINTDKQIVAAAGTNSLPALTTTGDLNTGIYFPAADTIGFVEGGAEAMRIDSSGNVGIGTTSLSVPLTVRSNSGGNAVRLLGRAADGFAFLIFRNNADSASNGEIGISDAQNMLFTIGGPERMRIDSSGNLLVGITTARANAGDVQVSKGISFPATQSAQSDANTLDDYEEGTITGSNLGIVYTTPGTSSITYDARLGTYTKIGRVVYFTIDIRIATFSKGTASGGLRVTGLPFAQRTTDGYDDARCTVQLFDWTYSSSPIIATVINGNTQINLTRMVSNSGSATLDDPRAASIIWITGFYFV